MKDPAVFCLLCGGGLTLILDRLWDDRFGAPGYYSIERCDRCGTEQTIPRLSAEHLRSLYERYYNFGPREISSRRRYEKLRECFLDSFLYRFWLAIDGDLSFHRQGGSGRRLLDVGCNEGRGLERYRANGFEAEGLELNRIAADAAGTRGFKVYTEEIDAFEPDVPFDVIVFSNVLEHTREPRAALQAANRLLGNRGEVWISLPNSSGILRKIFGRRWINWHVPYHLVHFSSETLLGLLKQEGFTAISVKTVTPAVWVVQALIAVIFSKPGQPTRQLRSIILVAFGMICVRVLLFPFLWLVNVLNRGDALLIRARRID